jgi:N6-L-threonylcarbamoyladenine synthase
MLGLSWSELGLGAALERFCAEKDDPQGSTAAEIPDMPSPARGQLAFSFSSYHSTIERFLRLNGGIEALDMATKRGLARSFQTAAVLQLEKKLLLAFRWCEQRGIKINHVAASGGVASNSFLRERLVSFMHRLSMSLPRSCHKCLCACLNVMVFHVSTDYRNVSRKIGQKIQHVLCIHRHHSAQVC